MQLFSEYLILSVSSQEASYNVLPIELHNSFLKNSIQTEIKWFFLLA